MTSTTTYENFERYYVTTTYPTLAFLGVSLNALILFALPRTNINHSTRLLMMAQALNSTMGLLVNGIYVPWRYCRPDMFQGALGAKLPGVLALFAVFAGVALIVSLSFNRFIFIWFPTEAPAFFCNAMVAATLILPCCLGVGFAAASVFDCCPYAYNVNGMLKWTYYGPAQDLQLRIAANTDYCLIAVSVVLNVCTMCKIVQIGRKIAAKTATSLIAYSGGNDFARQRFWRDLRLSLSFALVTLTWTGHVTLFVVVERKWGVNAPWTGLVSETFRCLLYLVDPLVYMFLTKEIRSAALSMFGVEYKRSSITQEFNW